MKYLRHLLFSLCLLATAATAADPAKTMFGVELGTRFAFPACARGEDALTKRHCYNAAQTSRTAWGTDEQHVFYPRAEIVPYARGELTVEVVNGRPAEFVPACCSFRDGLSDLRGATPRPQRGSRHLVAGERVRRCLRAGVRPP